MKVLNLLNVIIIEVKRDNKNIYLLLDSGFPHSFSNDINSISNTDLGIDVKFNLNLKNKGIDLSRVNELFGIKLSGILGIDFFHIFNNIKIDINEKQIEFNTNDFDYDFDIDLLNTRPFIINISLENNKNFGSCVVDTGAFSCMKFSGNFNNNYKSSRGWVFPAAMVDQMRIDYYSDVELYFNNNFSPGKYIVGISNNLPHIPFSYVLGLNFMTDYICFFDLINNKLKFKKSNKSNILNINTRPLYSLKFQVKIINKEIIVSNILDGCNLDINVGDKIIIPDLDMDNLEVVNDIYNKIIFLNSDDEIELICNNQKVRYKPVPLFS
ncbi:MAG TPA: hypothetical protein PLE45_11000 [Spirochaetota bacterium]|nr:hypothetical protein [Spirochaetota bacterium]HPP03850.1 hypothetical protein [Spirochaetota bacterium]